MNPPISNFAQIQPASDLQAWLQRSANFPSEYDDQLSSHLPMALQALHSLGADEAQMQAFFDHYVQRFQGDHAAPAVQDLPDWQAGLGDVARMADLRASFEAQLAAQGVDEVLRRVLPVLLPGLSAAAFHGAIRLAHALQAGEGAGAAQGSAHRAELAAALAYWASRWQRLPSAGAALASEPPLSLAEWSDRLQAGSRGWRSEAPLIFLRMSEASALPLYKALAPRLPPRQSLRECVADLAQLALGYYLSSANFTVLHMITGLRALRVLLPWLPQNLQQDPAVQTLLAEAFVAAYLAGRVQLRPQLASSPSAQALDWPTLIQAARRSTDDHAIKLVHACLEEWRVYGDDRYLRAAELALA